MNQNLSKILRTRLNFSMILTSKQTFEFNKKKNTSSNIYYRICLKHEKKNKRLHTLTYQFCL